MDSGSFLGEKNSPVVRRLKRFAEQNLGAGGIQFHRSSEIEKGSQKGKRLFGRKKFAGSPASQAFCKAKPWRRRNSLPPSKCSKRVPKKAKDFLGEKNSPVVRRLKRFAEQNLGAGEIQFYRASEIEKGSQKAKLFGKGKAGNPSSYLP